MQQTIIIGDVHGCREELQDLLRLCGFGRGVRLVLAGDLVAKGPDSQGVVQLAREAGAIAVLGNHDAHVLRARAQEAGETGDFKKVKPEHRLVMDTLTAPDWSYLEHLPLYLRLGREKDGDPETVVLHAGAVPGVAMEQQRREDLINMRSITTGGEASKRIEGVPWAAMWRGPERIVFGHDAVRGIQEYPLATGLDSGCVYGLKLTALLLPEGRMVSVPAKRAYAS